MAASFQQSEQVERSRVGKQDRARVFLDAAFHSHKPKSGRARSGRVREFSSVTVNKEERRGAATPAYLTLVEAGGGRGRRPLLFSPQIKAAVKIGVRGRW